MLAGKIYKAKLARTEAFPKKDIPTLVELAIQVVAQNYECYPELKAIPQNIKDQIIAKTSLTIPVTTTASNIDNESYWKAASSKFQNCYPEDHGNSYKQAYLERHIKQVLENYKGEGGIDQLKRELSAARYHVFTLQLTELQSHLDMKLVFQHLPNLTFFSLTYGAKHVGMDYERSLFGMKMSDAAIFADCLRFTQSLVTLSLPRNLIDDDLVRMLMSGLMLNKTITELDLSHNRISDAGARRIAKYLLKTEILTHFNLSDNLIHYEGSRYIGQALRVNKSLTFLSLKLNRLDDKAGSKLLKDIQSNNDILQELNFSSNSLGHLSAESLAELLSHSKSIRRVDISCNFLADKDVVSLRSVVIANPRIVLMDIRNNNLSRIVEKDIEELVTKNELAAKKIKYIERPPTNASDRAGSANPSVGKMATEVSQRDARSPTSFSPKDKIETRRP